MVIMFIDILNGIMMILKCVVVKFNYMWLKILVVFLVKGGNVKIKIKLFIIINGIVIIKLLCMVCIWGWFFIFVVMGVICFFMILIIVL